MTKTKKRILWTAIAAVGFELLSVSPLLHGNHFGRCGSSDAWGTFALLSHLPALFLADALNLPDIPQVIFTVCGATFQWFVIIWVITAIRLSILEERRRVESEFDKDPPKALMTPASCLKTKQRIRQKILNPPHFPNPAPTEACNRRSLCYNARLDLREFAHVKEVFHAQA